MATADPEDSNSDESVHEEKVYPKFSEAANALSLFQDYFLTIKNSKNMQKRLLDIEQFIKQ